MYVWKRLVGKKSQSVRRSDHQLRHLETGIQNKDSKSEEIWQPMLLPGEEIVRRVSEIVSCNPFGCSEDDVVGELIITNFRLIFSQNEEMITKNNGRKTSQRSRLIGSNDIALYNIDSVYCVKKKKKKLIQGGKIPRHVNVIEIHCKDFRVYIFHLKFLNEKNETILMLNAILNGAFPQQLHSLFAFKYNFEMREEDVPRFNSEQDWKKLLEQKGALGAFRVVQCNKDFRVSDSLPEFFVVPSSLSESEVVSSIKMFSNNRCPVWSYTHPNGASIVRMASAIPGVGEELEIRMVEHISRSNRKERGVDCNVTDLNKLLPSLSEIQSNYEAIRSLCMPGSLKEFWLSDAVWFSSLESSHWLSSVSCCLAVAKEVATDITNGKTVVLKELDAVDFAPLVSCLAQFIVDVDVRTVDGFQRLIEREWVALGHKFAERCGQCHSTKTDVRSAIFLLFLDCVWQIIRQFPSQIQFTEYFLVSIWDGVCLGIFRNFLFDNMHSSHSPPPKTPSQEVYITRLKPPTLLSIWDWEQQLSDDQIALFYSPQYVFMHESSLKDQLRNISVHQSGLLSVIDANGEKSSKAKDLLLMPEVETAQLQFWSLCYLRWLPAAEVISGGPASEYLSQCILVEEILYLCQMIEMELADAKRSQNRRSSRLIFGSDSNKLFLHNNSCSIYVSSSFPFAVDRPTDARFGPGSFIDSYFRNSVLYDSGPTSDELDE